MKAKDCLFRLRELRGKISGGDEKFDEERIAAMLFAENAIVSVPINCENIYFDEYGFAHDKKLEKPFTNADRIRAMTDEELVNEIFYILYHVLEMYNDSRLGLLDWLKQEVEQ